MSRFVFPVQGSISQGFGANADYYQRYGQLGHNGLDIAAAAGTPIYAAADGTVIFEGWGKAGNGYPGWAGNPAGIWTLIDHGDCYTGYAHQMDTVVSAGQQVKQGQLIGHVGSTGDASGPHTHFEFLAKPPVWTNGYAGRLNPDRFNLGSATAQGDEEVIRDTDNEYWRWNKLGLQIRGRTLTRDEFRKAAVGKQWLTAMEILSDSPEAEAATNAQQVGQVAVRDNWQGQIYGLLDQVKALQGRPTQDQLNALQSQVTTLTKSVEQCTTEKNSLIEQQQADQAAGTNFLRRLGQILGLIK